MKTILFSIFILAYSITVSRAQNYSYRFESTIEKVLNTTKQLISQTDDDFYHVLSQDTNQWGYFISKFDKRGTHILDKLFYVNPITAFEEKQYCTPAGMLAMDDGSNIVLLNKLTTTNGGAISLNSLVLQKIDSNYNIVFTRELKLNFQNNTWATAQQIIYNNAHDAFYIVGNLTGSNFYDKFTFFIKIDLNGNVQFSKVIPQGSYYNFGITVDDNDNLYSYEYCGGCDSASIIKVNANGDYVWQKFYSVQDVIIRGMAFHPQTKQLLGVGMHGDSINAWHPYALLIDTNGNVISSDIYTNTTYECSYFNVFATSDSGWVCKTQKHTMIFNMNDLMREGMVKIDMGLNVQKNKFYLNNSFGYFEHENWIRTNDNGYAFLSYANFSNNYLMYLCKIDNNIDEACSHIDMLFTKTPLPITRVDNTNNTYVATTMELVLSVNENFQPLNVSLLCLDSAATSTSLPQAELMNKNYSLVCNGNQLMVTQDGSFDYRIFIYSTDGKLIIQQRGSKQIESFLMPSNISNRMFLFKIETKSHIVTGKFMAK